MSCLSLFFHLIPVCNSYLWGDGKGPFTHEAVTHHQKKKKHYCKIKYDEHRALNRSCLQIQICWLDRIKECPIHYILTIIFSHHDLTSYLEYKQIVVTGSHWMLLQCFEKKYLLLLMGFRIVCEWSLICNSLYLPSGVYFVINSTLSIFCTLSIFVLLSNWTTCIYECVCRSAVIILKKCGNTVHSSVWRQILLNDE